MPPGGRAPWAETRSRDGSVWEDDSIELFLDPGHTHQRYFQLVGNAAGACLDARERDAAWNADWSFAARRVEGGWEGEFAIPFASLGVAAPAEGAVWGLNVCVNVHGQGGFSWSPLQQGYHEPGRFGHLRFSQNTTAGVASLAGLLAGTGEVQLRLEGPDLAVRSRLLRDETPLTGHPPCRSPPGATAGAFPVRALSSARPLPPVRYRLSPR